MNRKELVEEIAEVTGHSRTNTERFLTSFIDTVTKNMKKKDGVRLVGFGAFTTTKRKARTGRNPQTGEDIKIPARKVPVFKAGALLRQAVDKK